MVATLGGIAGLGAIVGGGFLLDLNDDFFPGYYLTGFCVAVVLGPPLLLRLLRLWLPETGGEVNPLENTGQPPEVSRRVMSRVPLLLVGNAFLLVHWGIYGTLVLLGQSVMPEVVLLGLVFLSVLLFGLTWFNRDLILPDRQPGFHTSQRHLHTRILIPWLAAAVVAAFLSLHFTPHTELGNRGVILFWFALIFGFFSKPVPLAIAPLAHDVYLAGRCSGGGSGPGSGRRFIKTTAPMPGGTTFGAWRRPGWRAPWPECSSFCSLPS